MKVTREEIKPKFEPITIIIETKEEAICLWHRLNESSMRIRGLRGERLRASYSLEMWKAFGNVFDPRKEN